MNSPPRSDSPITLATLICERDAAMAAITLPRLQANCRDASSFTIFEDGSLTERSAHHILGKLQNARLIRRKELDETVAESLSRRPNSRKYWGRNYRLVGHHSDRRCRCARTGIVLAV